MTTRRPDKTIPPDELLAIGYRLAERHGNCGADRDDAAQDFCLGALTRRAAGAGPSNPKGHEYAAGHRHQRDGERVRRRNARYSIQLNGHDVADECDVAENLKTVETRETVERALGLLRPNQRAVIRLRFGLCDGVPRSLAQVASLAHRSPERVRQIEQAALRRLRKFLDPHIWGAFHFPS